MGPTLVFKGTIAYAPSPPLAVGTAAQVLLATLPSGTDDQDGGKYRIVGTVKEKGTPNTPVFRRVLLCDQLSGRVVRSVWSDAITGGYNFNHIRLGTFYVISFDHAGAFRAVVADNLVSELMP